jgi:hypothetical protein
LLSGAQDARSNSRTDNPITKELYPRRKVIFDKLVKKLPTFYGTRRSLCSRESSTCPYPEPDESNPHPKLYFLRIQLNIILPSTSSSFKWLLSFRPSNPNLVGEDGAGKCCFQMVTAGTNVDIVYANNQPPVLVGEALGAGENKLIIVPLDFFEFYLSLSIFTVIFNQCTQ